MLDRASIREHNDYAAQAALHDKKMKNQRTAESAKSWENSKDSELNHDKVSKDMTSLMEQNRNVLKR